MKKILFILALFFPTLPVLANDYATLNRTYCHTDWDIDGTALIATKNTLSYWHSCGSDMSKTTGKWYFEITFTQFGQLFAGISSDNVLNNYVGETTGSWGYFSADGSIRNNNTTLSTQATFSNTDVIGVAFNGDSGEVSFYKNNALQYTATGLTGAFRPYCSANNVGDDCIFNFGASTQVYSPPTGFLPGWYTATGGGGGSTGLITSAGFDSFIASQYDTLVLIGAGVLTLAFCAGLVITFRRVKTELTII